MASLEKNCIAVEIAMLENQADLAGVSIVDYDTDAAGNKDRIVVKAYPREPEIYRHSTGRAQMFRIVVDVELIMATKSATEMDTYVAAVEAANRGSAPASVVALANQWFSTYGLHVSQTADGEKTGDGSPARHRIKTFHFVCADEGGGYIFLEDGFSLLQESGDEILQEA